MEKKRIKRDKKTRIVGKIFLFIIFTSIIWSLLTSVVLSVKARKWLHLISLFFTLMLMVLLAYRWVMGILAARDEYRSRMFAKEQVRLRDAMLYALSYSREIYRTIPKDHKHLVKYSFILIGLPFLFLSLRGGWQNVSYNLLYILLALAGFNLLIWLVASEREEKERLKIELDTARLMQLSLLPAHPPRVPGIDIAGFCVPARSVGGDHYDFVWLGKERKRLGVADAMNGEDKVFGLERLQQVFRIAAVSGFSAEETVNSIRSAVGEFVGGAEQYDDITLVSLRVAAAG